MSTPLQYCLCSQCAQTALFELGVQALSPREFVERAKKYTLTEEQQRIFDGMKLQAWNDAMKGEQAS